MTATIKIIDDDVEIADNLAAILDDAGDIDPDWMPVDVFIEKPVTPEHLLATVSELLER